MHKQAIFTATLTAFAINVAAIQPVHAHTDFTDNCSINFSGELEFHHDVLTITLEDDREITFNPDGDVTINGTYLDLDYEQQTHAQNYYTHITDSMPMTVNIAVDALEIASTAVTEAFGELLGYDDELTQEFGVFFDELSVNINDHFYAEDGSFHIESSRFDNDNWIDNQWEEEFDQKVEDLISKSMGRLLIAIGTEMLFSDGGDGNAFEARMESLGASIEQRVESQAADLEVRADELCLTLSKADIAEEALRSDISLLHDLNIISVNHSKFSM
ncbi:MAG: DUF2884 family protein [Alteromonas sp.]